MQRESLYIYDIPHTPTFTININHIDPMQLACKPCQFQNLRFSRPMATRLVSSPSPLVAFSSVAWDDTFVVVPMCGETSNHVFFFTFCKAKLNCLKLQTWLYNACVN